MSAVLPSLSSAGWVSDPSVLIPNLLAEAMVSDASQSTIYFGEITSIADLVQKYQTNPSEMANRLEGALIKYYSRYYSSGVNASVSVPLPIPTDGKYQINMSVIVTTNGKDYSVSMLANVENGILKNTLKIIDQ